MQAALSFTVNRIVRIVFAITGVLFLLGLVATYLIWELRYETALGFIPLFNLDGEYNIPTLFSVGLIATNSLLLLFIAKHQQTEKKKKHYWKVLSAIFLFLAFDELTSTHERIGGVVYRLAPNLIEANESRYWIVPFGLLLGLFSIYFFRFVWQLPAVTRNRFVAAGLVYITGAIAIEWLGDRYIWNNTYPDLNYGLYSCFEELFEMTGMVLFLRALFLLLGSLSDANLFHLRFSTENSLQNGKANRINPEQTAPLRSPGTAQDLQVQQPDVLSS
ncbi:hypothetical protein HRG84_01345 [Flavisolibacter sp. BT320]|nr:hypothetical protein [Flavisolibacter longurius]